MKKYQKNRIWLIGGAVAILVIILAISLGFLIHGRIYSARVSIMVVPSIAKVKIGDVEFGSFGSYDMKPGEYTVEIMAEGFASKTGKITLSGDKTTDLNMYLVSNSEATADWYNNHTEDALIMGEIKNAEALDNVSELLKKEPVLSKLPLTVEYYSDNYSTYTKYVISYKYDDSDRGFYLIMKDYTEAGLDAAVRKLTEMGMDMTGLRIEYENYSNDSLNYRAE